jgi:hypothetical protein
MLGVVGVAGSGWGSPKEEAAGGGVPALPLAGEVEGEVLGRLGNAPGESSDEVPLEPPEPVPPELPPKPPDGAASCPGSSDAPPAQTVEISASQYRYRRMSKVKSRRG